MSLSGSVTPRRVRFHYPDDLDPVWTPLAPEFACAANAVSLMMPTVEPYFVRTVERAIGGTVAGSAIVSDELRTRTGAYLAQERAHHGQHQRFNRLLRARYPALAHLERAQSAAYRTVERRASLGFNLAVVTVSETMAYSAARWAAAHRRELFDRADPVAATLFLWHLAEEVEHKASAHDVHRAVEEGRPWWRLRLVVAMIVALALVAGSVLAGTTVMLATERRLHHPLAWLRLLRWSVLFAFELATNLAVSLLPRHHPTDFADPLWYEVWLRSFDAERGTLAVWSDADGASDAPGSDAPG